MSSIKMYNDGIVKKISFNSEQKKKHSKYLYIANGIINKMISFVSKTYNFECGGMLIVPTRISAYLVDVELSSRILPRDDAKKVRVKVRHSTMERIFYVSIRAPRASILASGVKTVPSAALTPVHVRQVSAEVYQALQTDSYGSWAQPYWTLVIAHLRKYLR